MKNNKKEEVEHKQGPPWSIIAHFSSYDQAASKVEEELSPESDYEFKIKRYQDGFRVKKRLKLHLMEKKKNKKKNDKKWFILGLKRNRVGR